MPCPNKSILSVFYLNPLGLHLFICKVKIIKEPSFGAVMRINEFSCSKFLVQWKCQAHLALCYLVTQLVIHSSSYPTWKHQSLCKYSFTSLFPLAEFDWPLSCGLELSRTYYLLSISQCNLSTQASMVSVIWFPFSHTFSVCGFLLSLT